MQHDVHEWHNLNLSQYLETYAETSMVEKVDFIELRFELFAKRVNKKSMAYIEKKLINSEMESFVQYFKTQK